MTTDTRFFNQNFFNSMPKIVVKVDRKAHTRSQTQEDKKVTQQMELNLMTTQIITGELLQARVPPKLNPAHQYLEFKDLKSSWRIGSFSLLKKTRPS